MYFSVIREAEAEVIKNKEDRVVPLVEQYVELQSRKAIEKAKKVSLREGLLKGRLKGRQEGRLEGRQEGRQEGVKKVVLKMLKEDVDLRLISKITGLSKREINKLKK